MTKEELREVILHNIKESNVCFINVMGLEECEELADEITFGVCTLLDSKSEVIVPDSLAVKIEV